VARDSWAPAAPLEFYLSDQQDSTVDGNSPMPLLTPSSLSGESRTVFTFNANPRTSSIQKFFTQAWEAIQSVSELFSSREPSCKNLLDLLIFFGQKSKKKIT